MEKEKNYIENRITTKYEKGVKKIMIKEITKKEFQKYENVRMSGVTNMFDVRTVEYLSGLDRDTIFAIMKQYSELMIKYPDVRK